MNDEELSVEELHNRPPLRDLDPGIRQLVADLWDEWPAESLRTVSSCEGGDGHAFRLPTVVCEHDSPSELAADIAKTLHRLGYRGFDLSVTYSYQAEPHPWTGGGPPRVMVELWSEASYPPERPPLPGELEEQVRLLEEGAA